MYTAPQPIRFQDMNRQNRADHFRVVAPTVDGADVLLRGRYCAGALRSGLRLHATDIVDLHDLVTQARAEPGLTFGLFLEGAADVSLGQRAFRFGDGGGQAHAFALNCAEQDLFERRGQRGQRVRKVNVNLPRDWLEAEALPCAGGLAGLCRTHLASRTWVPTVRHLALAEKLLNPAPDAPFLESLYRETLCMEFVAEALRQWSGESPGGDRLDGRDRQRLRRACDYIDAHHDSRLHLDAVAHAAGMSVSALQRLFRAAYGTSVLDWARARRLDRARESLAAGHVSVTEAALAAGYTSPANFATAFKRRFGLSPKGARQDIGINGG